MYVLCYWGEYLGKIRMCWENMAEVCACLTRGYVGQGILKDFDYGPLFFQHFLDWACFLFCLQLLHNIHKNTCSEGTDEAVVRKHCCASMKRWGYTFCDWSSTPVAPRIFPAVDRSCTAEQNKVFPHVRTTSLPRCFHNDDKSIRNDCHSMR